MTKRIFFVALVAISAVAPSVEASTLRHLATTTSQMVRQQGQVATPTVVVPRGHMIQPNLYPSPRPGIPSYVGVTRISNAAFAPHEMMHKHRYRALYPPYYWKVKGSWIWTPFGMKSHDQWELQGTQVDIRYRTGFGILSNFYPPTTR